MESVGGGKELVCSVTLCQVANRCVQDKLAIYLLCVIAQARMKAASERLSKTEGKLGRALEAESLRTVVDEAQVARDAACAEVAKARIEIQVSLRVSLGFRTQLN